ncbi:hypothetical protein SAMN05446935_0353 [Burkholderia sp. YR290]|nr:hypothetical protein SAMN05446935_0353 [Burkholderia sp. YR290]
MNAKFTTDTVGLVTLAYDRIDFDDSVQRIERTFSCPLHGGYITEKQPDGSWKQICTQLGRMGNTLTCQSRDRLADKIRREYRAMRRAEKAE